MRERTATGLRAWVHASRAAIEEAGFALWRPLWGGQCLESPIFMIGAPRSGTSISAMLFARHPDVANFSEAGEIWDPHHYADLDADHHWTAAEVTAQACARLHDRFEFARRLRRRGRLLNKHPRNSVRIEYLRTIFADAIFIHVIRDGRAVVHSMLEMMEREPDRKEVPMGAFCKPPDWRDYLRDDPIEQAAWQWREIVSYVLSQRESLGERYHQYRYEDLCRDTQGTLGRAFAFAGLRADASTLAHLPRQLASQNFKWQQAFDPSQIETLIRVQGTLLSKLGYDL